MNKKYVNIYNNLVQLSRNKDIYSEFTKKDTFSDRLLILLLHFAFLLRRIKETEAKDKAQDIHDSFFTQLELNLREIGHGDAKINKFMKIYVNNFFNILNNIIPWENLSIDEKESVIKNVLGLKLTSTKLINYFDRYSNYIKKTSLISFLKGVLNPKF
tara:strand:- start:280 stop:753 length:474 start_codon:yes stop_codon:yes gene_type:complete